MKKLSIKMFAAVIASVALACGSAAAAEKDYEVSLSEFSGISATGDFQVYVKEGNGFSVTLTVEEVLKDYVQAEVNGSVLVLSVDTRKIPAEIKKAFRGKGNEPVYKAVVTMPARLSSVELGDKAGLQFLSQVADVESFRMTLSDNSVVLPFEFKTGRLEVSMDKRAQAEFTVECTSSEVSLSGSSSLTMTQKAENSQIALTANSNFVLNGNAQTLGIGAKMASKAVLNGNVASVTYNLTGSSNVNAVNLIVDDAFVEMNSICTLVQSASKNLHINISNGASLTFKNDPVFHITNIKSASVIDYDK